MLPLQFPGAIGRPLRVLCLGAHSDDLEIGCGGTVLHLLRRYPGLTCTWVVFSGEGQRRHEAEAGAAAFLAGAGATRVSVLRFRDGFFPEQWGRIKEAVEELKAQEPPDVILTHHRYDRHQDHRILADLTWNAWRNHLILEYEIPKYEGDLGHPNLYVPVDHEVADLKVENLMHLFETQRSRSWFDRETFLGLLRLRGVECASPSGYAEAFHAAKLTLT